MGATKSDHFTTKQNKKAALYKALGHPARIAILELLIQQESCVCGDLVHKLPLSQSTISQHLKELKEVGIIKGEIEGVKTCYCIDDKVWSELNHLSSLFIKSFIEKEKCC